MASNSQTDDIQETEGPTPETIVGQPEYVDGKATGLKSDSKPGFAISSALASSVAAFRLAKAVHPDSAVIQALHKDNSALAEWNRAAARLNEVYGSIDSSFARLAESTKTLNRVMASMTPVVPMAPIIPMTPLPPIPDVPDVSKMIRSQQEAEKSRQVEAIKKGIESSPLADALRIQLTELENLKHGLQTANKLLTTQVGTLVEHLEQARTTSEQQAKADRFQVWLAISIAFGTLAAATAVQLWLSSQSASNDQAVVQLLQTIVNLLGTR